MKDITHTYNLENQYYSCQYCGREIVSKHELEITPFVIPLCSQRCKYRLIYGILASYERKWLLNLFNTGYKGVLKRVYDKKIIPYLVKEYAKIVLPTLKPLKKTNTLLTRVKKPTQKTNTHTLLRSKGCVGFSVMVLGVLLI